MIIFPANIRELMGKVSDDWVWVVNMCYKYRVNRQNMEEWLNMFAIARENVGKDVLGKNRRECDRRLILLPIDIELDGCSVLANVDGDRSTHHEG